MSSSALLREAEIRRKDLVASLEGMGFPTEYAKVAVQHVDPFLTNALPLCLHFMDENPYEAVVPEHLRPKKEPEPEKPQPKPSGSTTEDDVDAALADKTEMLVKMGFSHTEASLGLVCNDNNIAKSIVWILAQRAMHLEELIAVEKGELDLLTPYGTPGQDGAESSDDDGDGEELKDEEDEEEVRSEAVLEIDDPLADEFPPDHEYPNDMDFVVRDDEVDRWANEEKRRQQSSPAEELLDDANFNEDDYVDVDEDTIPDKDLHRRPDVVIDVLSQKYIRSQEEIKMLQTEVQRLQSVISKFHDHFVSVKSEVRDARRRIIRNARLKGSFKPGDWKKSLRQWRGEQMDSVKQHRSNRIKFYGAQNLNSNNNSPVVRLKSPPGSNRSSCRSSPGRSKVALQELKSQPALPKSQRPVSPEQRAVAISARQSPAKPKKKKRPKKKKAQRQQQWSKVWHTKSWNPYAVAKRGQQR